MPSIVHVGGPLDACLAAEARATMAACPAYRWLGALSHTAARRAIARARALVHCSRMEGGAEALAGLIRRFCADAAFAAALRAQCAVREPLFRPAAERNAVRSLVTGLLPARYGRR